MMAKKNAFEALTQPQQVALDAFRERHGRNWKSALRESWERARYRNTSPDDAAALQQVRNSLGPEWLAQYRPSEVRAEDARLVVSITDTCTQAFADVGRQAEMKRILRDIQTGQFVTEWMRECKAGQAKFKATRRLNDSHQIEEVGAKLRGMMPWIKSNALVDKAKN